MSQESSNRTKNNALLLPPGSGPDTIHIVPLSVHKEGENIYEVDQVTSIDTSGNKSEEFKKMVRNYLGSSENQKSGSRDNKNSGETGNEESKNPIDLNQDASADTIIVGVDKIVVSQLLINKESAITGEATEELKILLPYLKYCMKPTFSALKKGTEFNEFIKNIEICIASYPNIGCLYVIYARAFYSDKKRQEAYDWCNQIITKEASFQMLYQLVFFNPPAGVILSFGQKDYRIDRWRNCFDCNYQFDYLKDTQYLCLFCRKHHCESCNNKNHSEEEKCPHNFAYVIKSGYNSMDNLKIGIWKEFDERLIYASRNLSNSLPFKPKNKCVCCKSKPKSVWYQCAHCLGVRFCVWCKEDNKDYLYSLSLKNRHEYWHALIKITIPE